MRTIFGCTALALLFGLLGCGKSPDVPPDPGPPPLEWSNDMQTLADGNNRFACDLYGKLREDEKGNLFFSPYSVHTALSMTATGAKGNTRAEMVKVLHLPADEGKVLASGDLGRFYGHPRTDYEFSVANALWGQKGFPWRPEWLAVQNDRFGAGFQEADFAANPDAERQRINRWVEEKTRDKIKELLEPPHVTSRTTIVLTNAIYFKGKWAEQFDPKKTRDGTFRLADGTTKTVPMMRKSEGKFRYGRTDDKANWDDGVQILELPYKGDELAMVVILPPKPDGLRAVEKQLTAENLTKWLGGLKDLELDVSLPRFRMETKAELIKKLIALGMIDAFDGNADFTGMSTTSPGFISAVVHKAFVDVNEEGTEAAATAVVIGELSSDRVKPSFVADHPFLFLIRDVKHGTILFLGRVEKP